MAVRLALEVDRSQCGPGVAGAPGLPAHRLVYPGLTAHTVRALIQKPLRSGQGPLVSDGFRGFW